MSHSSRSSSWARRQPEFVCQQSAYGAVTFERVCLPAAAVERAHELAAQRFPQRLARHQRLEFGYEAGVSPKCQLRLDSRLERTQTQLSEAVHLDRRERLQGEVGERLAVPERERVFEGSGRPSGVASIESCCPCASGMPTKTATSSWSGSSRSR